MAATPSSSAVRALSLEYKSLQEEPVEGFRVKLLNEDNLFEWEVAIFGPPDTLYQGGYFKLAVYLHRFVVEPPRALCEETEQPEGRLFAILPTLGRATIALLMIASSEGE
ncbi:hypothetical protein ZHAS_00002629 [Anopheles sinensis]|uniref:UBC core domain-containing protein n=1 Tax=Anopheles sinensis TaxID=74873 RepID=A0A084VCN5_ANOSI|nr:hypothetical protein ZHAS_00002629 [Anopheles sinensis]